MTTRAISIDPNYADRRGYDQAFLGQPVPTPALSAMQIAVTTRLIDHPDRWLLHYHHFSVIMHARRRLPFFTAVNIDGQNARKIRREPDTWHYDPRIAREQQIGRELYEGNDLDYGHLVRRLDPAWGADLPIAKQANDDTYHFTNCAPQHALFNRNKQTWAGLENYILNSAIAVDTKLAVFTGPILADNDPEFRDVKIPTRFWKTAVLVKANGELSATAYVLDQSTLIATLGKRGLELGAFKTFQIRVDEIEQLTGLKLGHLVEVDPLAKRRGLNLNWRELNRPGDLCLE